MNDLVNPEELHGWKFWLHYFKGDMEDFLDFWRILPWLLVFGTAIFYRKQFNNAFELALLVGLILAAYYGGIECLEDVYCRSIAFARWAMYAFFTIFCLSLLDINFIDLFDEKLFTVIYCIVISGLFGISNRRKFEKQKKSTVWIHDENH